MSFWFKSMAAAFIFSTMCWAVLVGGIALYVDGIPHTEQASTTDIKVVQ